MHLQRATYRGSSAIGMYGFCTDAFAFFPPNFSDTEALDVGVDAASVDNSVLLGIFLAGNADTILVSDIIYPRERETLAEHAPVNVIDTVHTALGNLILCNEKGAYISPLLKAHREALAAALDVPVRVGTVANLDTVGSCGVATNTGVLLHRDAEEAEIAVIEEVLDVPADIGSVNFGSPYIKSGLIANTRGFLIGEDTTGPEVQRIDEALGFLE